MSATTFMSRAAAHALNAPHDGANVGFSGCAIDSRKVQPGQMFAALPGEHSDGHLHVSMAVDNGASVALIERPVDTSIATILVPAVGIALGHIAATWRAQHSPVMFAVTGSNGKTTVKELVGSIVNQCGSALVTPGNLNNDLGLPMTLLGLNASHEYCVLEMGANNPGEIAYLARCAIPQFGIITHCGPAHLEGFGSIEGVANAKGELIANLPRDGRAILNADDQFFNLWKELAGTRAITTFGLDQAADVSASWSSDGIGTTVNVDAFGVRLELRSNLLGRHNVMNVLAAVAASKAAGLPDQAIRDGIAEVQPVAGRLRAHTAKSGARIIDDSYNANPASLQAALNVLSDLPGTHWLVMGDMAELGTDARRIHAEMGCQIRDSGVKKLCTIGALSHATSVAFGDGAQHFSEHHALSHFLHEHLAETDTALVKGSRSMAMERIVQALVVGEGV